MSKKVSWTFTFRRISINESCLLVIFLVGIVNGESIHAGTIKAESNVWMTECWLAQYHTELSFCCWWCWEVNKSKNIARFSERGWNPPPIKHWSTSAGRFCVSDFHESIHCIDSDSIRVHHLAILNTGRRSCERFERHTGTAVHCGA